MSDERLCVICGALINLSDPAVKIVQQPGGSGRRTIISVGGMVHILTTKRLTESRIAQEES